MRRIKDSKLGTLLEFGELMSFVCRRLRWSLSIKYSLISLFSYLTRVFHKIFLLS